MKRVLFLVSITLLLVFSACSTAPEEQELPATENKVALGLLSYISTSFLDAEIEMSPVAYNGIVKLGVNPKNDSNEPTTVIEDELDQVNIYVDKLKSFIELGTEGFGEIAEEDSDKPEYENMLSVTVEDHEYLLYYNIDTDSEDISGIFILDDVEYTIMVENSYYKFSSDEEESKDVMKLMVRHESDSIIIEYESKNEESDSKQTFKVKKFIDGVVDTIEIEIKDEGNEYKLTITENENVYIFKAETEEDGELTYKLHYIVNGVKGHVKILEKVNDEGEIYYVYRVQEGSNKIEIELEDPDNTEVPETEPEENGV